MSQKTYNDILNGINDKVNDSNFTSGRANETLRAINTALNIINDGITDDDKGMDIEVGYNFQKAIASVSFTSGTKNYSFSTLSIDVDDFKFSNDLRINSDRNVFFNEVDPDYFFRKEGVNSSTQYMYTIADDAGTRSLWINYFTTDTLDFEYFTTHLVADSDGTNRDYEFTDTTGTRILLIPNRYFDCVAFLAASELQGSRMGYDSDVYKILRGQGMIILKRMINSIGKIRKNPSKNAKVRSEFFGPPSRITTN